MTTSNDDEKKEKRPRRVIHETQEQCLDWQDLCMNIHQGIGRVEPEVAIRGFHNAVLRYWSILRTYSQKESIQPLWTSDELIDVTPFDVGAVTVESLADCGRLRYAAEQQYDIKRDPVNGAQRNSRSEPVYLRPDQSSSIFDALNDVADELNLLASIKEQRQLYHIPAGGDENEYPEAWGEAEPPTS